MKTKKFLLAVLVVLILIIVVASFEVMAQPPGLPSTPSQAPIDGGLGLLAAAGGAYALKKLKKRKRDGEDF
ncbi:MAG: hypothetical protein MI700_12415 [Balneolales bacterium]|nr:hypothetical protein [Balneolales bacterium]